MSTTLRQGWAALRLLLVLTVILGIAYPLLIAGVGRVAVRHQADGSRLVVDGAVVGSSLIGQQFDGPTWFSGRPSAAGDGYDTNASGASNLSATSDVLLKDVKERRAAVAKANGVAPSQVPADAVTASGSGLDPHISPAYAKIQIARVAKARGLSVAEVTRLVEENTQGRSLGFVGEPRVNVLKLNLALQALK